MSEMIESVKRAFIERLDVNTWLDDETKAASKEKVNAITKMVAFPDQLFNDTYLNGLYAEVSQDLATVVVGDDHYPLMLRQSRKNSPVIVFSTVGATMSSSLLF